MRKNFMQLSNICNYQYFIFRWFYVIYVGTSELHFCSPHWIQKYLDPKKLSACAKPPYLISPPCIPSPYSVPPHACPPPILSHPMHTLPLFYPTPMHALPLFYTTHACPSPILSHLMHILPLYSIPAHAYPPPILSHPMHTFPLFYPTPCIPSPYSIPAHAQPPPILCQPIHTPPYFIPPHAFPLSILFLPYMPSFILSHHTHVLSCSLPEHTCIPSILFHLMHALLTPCHMNLEGMLTFSFDIWECRFWICSHWVYHHHLPSLVIWSINLWHLNVCCFHSHELTTLISSTLLNYIYIT